MPIFWAYSKKDLNDNFESTFLPKKVAPLQQQESLLIDGSAQWDASLNWLGESFMVALKAQKFDSHKVTCK